MHGEGWRRLWVLIKFLLSVGAGVWSVYSGAPDFAAEAKRIPLSNDQYVFGLLVMAVLPGGAVFILLHAFEWVFRGFRPLPDALSIESIAVAKDESVDRANPQDLPMIAHDGEKKGSECRVTVESRNKPGA